MGQAPSPVGCAADLCPQGEVKECRTVGGEVAFRPLCKLGVLLSALLIASPTLADGVLPIRGAFGNGTGCTLFMTGQALDIDAVLLTPDNFVAERRSCHFLELSNRAQTSFTVAASCSARDAETITVRQAEEGYFVAIGTAKEWGPLAPCPGAENAFAPLGTKV